MRRSRTRLRPSDAIAQSMFELASRPARSALTVLGTVLGVGMLVATLGLTASAQRHIDERFVALASTEVDAQRTDGGQATFSGADLARTRSIDGVRASGVLMPLTDVVKVAQSQLPVDPSLPSNTQGLTVTAADAGALDAIGAHLRTGRRFSGAERAHVVLLGEPAARQLGISSLAGSPAVLLNGQRFAVQGILDTARHHEELLLGVVVPWSARADLIGPRDAAATTVAVGVQPGYADAVSRVLPATLLPSAPAALSIVTPPDAQELRTDVASDVSGLFLLLAGVGVLVGVLGIASTTLVSVLERVPEIGLRRSLGARRGQIASQFLLESSLLGLLGGLVGASLGVVTVAFVSILRDWLPVLDPWVWTAAPATGLLTGLLAGAYPAVRAARVDPMIALLAQ